MDDPFSAEEKSRWFSELLKAQEEISARRCAAMVGSVCRVLVEEESKPGILSGRTSGNVIVEFPGDKSLIGQFKDVKVTKARNWILNGELA